MKAPNIISDTHKGKDGKWSQRSILGSIGFAGHFAMSTYGCIETPEAIPAILGINVGLIGFLLGMKTIQNYQEYKVDKTVLPEDVKEI